MKVLLLSSNTERINMPTMPVGLALVAAATRRAGHEFRFLDLMHEVDPPAALRRAVADFDPEVVGISVRNIDDQSMEDPQLLLAQVRPIVAACRTSTAAPIILGGAGYSLFPEQVLTYLGADYGIAGDGEVAFPALLEALKRGAAPAGIDGLHRAVALAGRHPETAAVASRACPPDLDALPLPEAELWSYLEPDLPDLWVPVQSRRGCANDCSYCSTAQIQGRKLRCRAPEPVVEHIAQMAEAGFRRFYVVDNSFNLPEPQAFELCERLAALNRKRDHAGAPPVSWRCILYPQRVSAALVDALADAGCVEVALGFESGSPRVLERMNKRYTPDDIRQTAALLAARGIRRMGFLLLGAPGETRDTVEESLALADALELELLRTTVGIRIYPDTPLARVALDEGQLDPTDDLLEPRFYLAREVAPWIHDRVQPGVRAKRRP